MMGRTGAVASANPLASLTGLDVLAEGGNAFDAAVAVSAVVPLGEPYMSGIGGVARATVYHARTDSVLTLDAEGGPTAALLNTPRRTEEPESGIRTAWLPGLVASWSALLDRFGTMKLERLLRPAIDHANHGVPVSFFLNSVILGVGLGLGNHKVNVRDGFAADARVGELFMPGGHALGPGDLLVQKRLAATLEAIAREGRDGFYRGSVGEEIARASAGGGGYITASDLAGVQAEWQPSLHIRYRDKEVHSVQWPGGGAQLLQTLALLNGPAVGSLAPQSAEHLHVFIESVKLAQADRVAHLGDETFDPKALLTEESVTRRRRALDPTHATRSVGDERVAAREAAPVGSETTHFVVADSEGNLVSVTQTLGNHFGSKAFAGETGVILNNLNKFPRRGLPMAPSVVMDRSGAPWMTVGSVGGPGILQTIAQMISNVADFRMNPQAAVEAPRFRVFKELRVMIETRVDETARAELVRRGHELDEVGEWAYGEGQLGRGQMIVRDTSGTLFAASDPRADGAAQAL
jgi:gamma-glutamyltranspeptidase